MTIQLKSKNQIWDHPIRHIHKQVLPKPNDYKWILKDVDTNPPHNHMCKNTSEVVQTIKLFFNHKR